MDQLKTGEVIYKRRRELELTQNQLAKLLNISFQAVSKWENGTAYPDIEMLPKLAAALHTTVDALLGYESVVTDYDKRYNTEEYYWGLTPNRICYDIMKILPPVKPYRVLHFMQENRRKELCDSLKAHTADGGINAMNVFVKKPFIKRAPDSTRDESKRHPWYSGELFGYYHDWLFHVCREEVFDCNSGGKPHKHCMDTLIAQKVVK